MQMLQTHFRPLVRLGVPIIIGQLGTIAQAFADTIMVGQYGTAELSAAGFVNNVFNLVVFFLLGFSYSTTPIVGAYFGRKQYADAARTLRESLVANLLVCGVAVALMLLLYFNLDLLRQPAELMPLIRSYFLIILASMPCLSAFNSLKQFCDGIGDTRTPMWIMIGGNVFNVAANGLFIFALDWGLDGAGVATLLSRLLMTAALWLYVRHRASYRQYREGFRHRITRRGMAHLTRVGLPISLQLSMEASSFNIAAIMMGWLGANALAAHQVMCTIGTLCFLVYYGIGAAASVRISHFRGRGQWAEVRRIAFAAFAMTLLSAVVLSGLIIALRTPLAYCFTTSAEVVALVSAMMLPFALYQLGDSMQVVFANSLRAIEDVKPLVRYAAIAYLLVSLPLSYLFAFPLQGGAVGIWYGFPFGLTTAGVLFLTRLLRQTKQAPTAS